MNSIDEELLNLMLKRADVMIGENLSVFTKKHIKKSLQDFKTATVRPQAVRPRGYVCRWMIRTTQLICDTQVALSKLVYLVVVC